MRLQKYLSAAGLCSRRKAEEYIQEGRIQLNGSVVTQMGQLVEPGDSVKFDGKKVILKERMVYLMLHKPEGYVTTLSDEQGRPTILSLLENVKERVYPIGRLDYNTSGLLLLTNDGELTNRLTHPKHQIKKIYQVKVQGHPDQPALKKLEKGIVIDESRRPTAPAEVKVLRKSDSSTTLRLVIYEGRNRQVRKMCEAIGFSVVSLKRVATGNLFLGDLPKGKHRLLTPDEIKTLKKSAGMNH